MARQAHDLCRMATPRRRGGSAELFRFKGIRVRVHWSFALLLAWVLYGGVRAGMDRAHVLQQLVLVLLVFTCVVLHEFGHALAAMRYGIRTRHITVLPIGGVASLERIPEKAGQELVVAIAGPAVNLVIAAALALLLQVTGRPLTLIDPTTAPAGPGMLVRALMLTNLGLLLFNLIPAFPMDGGRILRAFLSFTMDRVKATRIAAIGGRLCAAGFLLASFHFEQPTLALIALFVVMGASAEQRMVETEHSLRDVRVREVMRTRYWSMPHDATVQEAADELLAGGDHVLFLTRQGGFVQALPRADIIAAVQQGRQQLQLHELQGLKPEETTPDASAKEAYARLSGQPLGVLPVVEQGRLTGVLELDNLAEYLELHEKRPDTSGAPS